MFLNNNDNIGRKTSAARTVIITVIVIVIVTVTWLMLLTSHKIMIKRYHNLQEEN